MISRLGVCEWQQVAKWRSPWNPTMSPTNHSYCCWHCRSKWRRLKGCVGWTLSCLRKGYYLQNFPLNIKFAITSKLIRSLSLLPFNGVAQAKFLRKCSKQHSFMQIDGQWQVGQLVTYIDLPCHNYARKKSGNSWNNTIDFGIHNWTVLVQLVANEYDLQVNHRQK